jgi:outer membrane murein-binding lipoprotein Lpp
MEWIKKLGRWISEHVASFVAILVFLGLLIGGIVWIATQQARERDLTQQAQSLTAQAQLYQAQRDDARQKLDTANQELNAANRAADNLCAPAPKRRLTCLFTRIREHLPRHMHRDPGRGPIGLPAYLRYSPPL